MVKMKKMAYFLTIIIQDTENLFKALTLLYNGMLIHGVSPIELLTSGSIICKFYDANIIKQQTGVFYTSDLQCWLKDGLSTTMCTFTVKETISCYVNNGSTVHVLLLGASKAFDRMNYCLLFQKLVDNCVCLLVVRRLLHMYTNQKLQVRWNDVISNQFSVKNGVRQGGVMSPLLFGVYVDGLLELLKNLGIGCFIRQYFCGAAGYADDIILLCPTSSGLRKIIEVCEKYAKLHDVLLNGSKSKTLVYNKKDADPHCEINGTDVSTCEKTIHLGNVLSTTNKYEMVFGGIKKCNCSVNRLMFEFGSLQTVVKNKLFHQYCCGLYEP